MSKNPRKVPYGWKLEGGDMVWLRRFDSRHLVQALGVLSKDGLYRVNSMD